MALLAAHLNDAGLSFTDGERLLFTRFKGPGVGTEIISRPLAAPTNSAK